MIRMTVTIKPPFRFRDPDTGRFVSAEFAFTHRRKFSKQIKERKRRSAMTMDKAFDRVRQVVRDFGDEHSEFHQALMKHLQEELQRRAESRTDRWGPLRQRLDRGAVGTAHFGIISGTATIPNRPLVGNPFKGEK